MQSHMMKMGKDGMHESSRGCGQQNKEYVGVFVLVNS